jgi:DNA-directed RNA polymerase specialized sigma24 family protein
MRTTTTNDLTDLDAARVHAIARATILATRVPCDVADDLASEVAIAAIERIAAREVEVGREESYVRACAKNRARDHFRGRAGVFVAQKRRAPEAATIDLASPAPNAEALLIAREDAALTKARTIALRVAVAEAPPRYRAILEAVYVRGEEIEAVVDRELAARPAGTARRRVRNAVDKTIERARNWVRARVVTLVSE